MHVRSHLVSDANDVSLDDLPIRTLSVCTRNAALQLKRLNISRTGRNEEKRPRQKVVGFQRAFQTKIGIAAHPLSNNSGPKRFSWLRFRLSAYLGVSI